MNDDHGHSQGDRVLVEVAGRLRDNVRPGDLVSRLGGDEFGVVCPGLDDDAVAGELAERLIHAVGRPIALDDGTTVSVGASVGVAVGTTTDERRIIDAADGAMYTAKSHGKGSWELTRVD